MSSKKWSARKGTSKRVTPSSDASKSAGAIPRSASSSWMSWRAYSRFRRSMASFRGIVPLGTEKGSCTLGSRRRLGAVYRMGAREMSRQRREERLLGGQAENQSPAHLINTCARAAGCIRGRVWGWRHKGHRCEPEESEPGGTTHSNPTRRGHWRSAALHHPHRAVRGRAPLHAASRAGARARGHVSRSVRAGGGVRCSSDESGAQQTTVAALDRLVHRRGKTCVARRID